MMTSIWVVLAAALASVVIGFVWYHPKVFGTAWMSMVGLTPEDVEGGKKKMPMMALCALIASAVMAWVLSHFAFMWGVFTLGSALELAFWIWIGFMMPIALGPVLWEQKPLRLFAINAGYWLVTLAAMATIITLWS